MKSFVKEFKEFAVKGNMVDIAVGVIVGTAFNKVVNVLVTEIFLPPLALLTEGANWGSKEIILRDAIMNDGVVTVEKIALGYGKLFEATIDFLIIGLTVFLVIKFVSKLRKKADDPKDDTVKTPRDIELLNEVVTLLKDQNSILKDK